MKNKDLTKIRMHYSTLSDNKLIDLVIDFKKIEETYLPLIIEELKKRNIEIEIFEIIKLSKSNFSEFEIQNILSICLNNICPDCNQFKELNLHKISIVEYTSPSGVYKYFCCKSCYKKQTLNAMLKTASTGWLSWFGFIFVPYSLMYNIYQLVFYKHENKEVIKILKHYNGYFRYYLNNNNKDFSDLWKKINHNLYNDMTN